MTKLMGFDSDAQMATKEQEIKMTADEKYATGSNPQKPYEEKKSIGGPFGDAGTRKGK